MKLYHGTTKFFSKGDILKTSNDATQGANTSFNAVYATSYMKLAVYYSLFPINHDSGARGLYTFGDDIVLVSKWHTGNYVYEVDSKDFSLLGKYIDGTGDEWVSASDVKVIDSVEITPKILADCGYSVRIPKGGKFAKKIIFRLAKSKLMSNLFFKNREKFNKYMNVLTVKYDREQHDSMS